MNSLPALRMAFFTNVFSPRASIVDLTMLKGIKGVHDLESEQHTYPSQKYTHGTMELDKRYVS